MNDKLPGLFGCKVRQMTHEESETFLTLLINELEKQDDYFKFINKQLQDDAVFQYLVMVNRLEAFKQNFSPTLDIGIPVLVFLSSICDSPGQIVMWAHTLNEMFVKLGHKVTLSDFAKEFPMGIPIDEEYRRVWDLQKRIPEPGTIGGDNLIDDFTQWSLPKVSGKPA